MGRIGDDADDSHGHAVHKKGSPAQVYPTNITTYAAPLTGLHVNLSRELRLGEGLPNVGPILLHDMRESHFEIPERLYFDVAEDLIVPRGPMHRSGRQVEFPAAQASGIQCDLQEF